MIFTWPAPPPPSGRKRDKHGFAHPGMDETVFDRARGYAAELFAGDSGGHDIHHTLRVERLAVSIQETEGGDPDLVRLAAILHDVDDSKLFHTEGHPNARRFMESEGLDTDFQDRVCHVISQISFGDNGACRPDSIEGMIVQDADRLDAIGAIGIARTFAYGGSKGRPIHTPGEGPRMGMDREAYRSNKGSSINHFHEKLLLLKDRMNTDAGRRMAEHRHTFMEGFLEEFMTEWNGER